MDRGRARDIFAPIERAVGAPIIRDEPAGFFDQKHARGGVPDVEIVFPEAVHPPGGDPGEIERGRSEPANARDLRPDSGIDARPARGIATATMWHSRADHALVEVAP